MAKKQTKGKPEPAKPLPGKEKTSQLKPYRYLFEVLLFIGAIILYGQSSEFGYVLDDPIVTTNNRFVQQGTAGIPDLVTKGSTVGLNNDNSGTYRPVPLVMFAIEHELYGNDPKPSHWINILLYALTAVVVYRLLRHIFPTAKSQYLFLGALLFMAHPVHTEVVANIKSRDEIMAFLFGALSFIYAFRYAEAQKSSALAIALLCFGIACYSKESAIMFAPVIPLGLYFFTVAPIRVKILPALGFIGVAALYLLTRNLVLDETFLSGKMEIINNSLAAATNSSERFGTIFKIIGKYLLLLLFPLTLSSDYSFNQIPLSDLADPVALASLLIVLGLLVYSIFSLRKKTIYSFAIIVFFLLLLPVANLVITIGSTMGERFLYAPSLGFILALLSVISLATGNGPRLNIHRNSSLFLVIVGCITTLYAIRTAVRVPDWKDTLSLVAADVENAPQSARLHLHLAKEYTAASETARDPSMRVNLLGKALSEYHTALNIYPRFADGWYNLGHAFDLLRNPDSAYQAYLHTVEIDPRNPQAYNNMGVIHFDRKEYTLALPLFQKVLALDSLNLDAMGNIGAVYQNLGKRVEALRWYDKALAINPDLQHIKANRLSLQ